MILATGNLGKIREMEKLLAGLPLRLYTISNISNLPPLTEDQPDFAGNAYKKANIVARVTGEMALADDSGLCVAALDGKPGVLSARFAGEDADDAANNRLLLELLKNIPPEQRQAEFRCAVAIALPCGKTYLVEERTAGRIANEPAGTGGFVYDPLFIYEPAGITFAEMDPDLKNKVSHRGKALCKAREILRRLTEEEDGLIQTAFLDRLL